MSINQTGPPEALAILRRLVDNLTPRHIIAT